MLKKSVGKFDSKKWFVLLVVVIILKLIMNLLSLNVLYDIQKSESNLKGELAQAIGSSCDGNADCPSTGCLGTRLFRIACISGKCDYAHKIGECNSASTDSYYAKLEPESDQEESPSSPYDKYGECKQTVIIGYPKGSCKHYAVLTWSSCIEQSCIKKIDCIDYYTKYGLSHGASSTDIERFKYRCLAYQDWRNDACGYELEREIFACEYIYPLTEEDYESDKEDGDDYYKIKDYDYYIQ